MSQETQELTIQSGELREFSETLYRKAGVPPEHARVMANLQVETDLRGVYSHGTRVLPRYVQGILDGSINPTAAI
jgi:LDH2 family malate/lactate/ureidoglycolate dehydrogenase